MLTHPTHTKSMEKSSSTKTTKKAKKGSAMKKLGKTIKDTFVEMSSSLAGWIDDTGNQFMGKKKRRTTAPKKTSTTQQKTATTQTTSNPSNN